MPDWKQLTELTPTKFIRAILIIVIPILYFAEKQSVNNILKDRLILIKELNIALAICAKSKEEMYERKETEADIRVAKLERAAEIKDSMYIENLKDFETKIKRNNKVLKTLEK